MTVLCYRDVTFFKLYKKGAESTLRSFKPISSLLITVILQLASQEFIKASAASIQKLVVDYLASILSESRGR